VATRHTRVGYFSRFALCALGLWSLYVPLSKAGIDAVSLFRKANASVVVLRALDRDGQPFKQGSGFIISGGSAIVTNYHVIAGADAVEVSTPSGQVFRATTVIRIEENTDLAILETTAKTPLVGLKLGDSSLVNVGDEVVAIGSPQGLENTISTGIVSGLRVLDNGASYIQTTAPISAGSSGGPLLNSSGDVVGITTFLVTGGQNLNFCVPVNRAAAMLRQPKQTSLSVLARTKHRSLADFLGLWSYDTVCDSCVVKHASGTIFVKAGNGYLIVEGHITYTDGSKFTWVEQAYVDGSTMLGYAVNDRGDVGVHTYDLEDGRMKSMWVMSNGASGNAISGKLSETP